MASSGTAILLVFHQYYIPKCNHIPINLHPNSDNLSLPPTAQVTVPPSSHLHPPLLLSLFVVRCFCSSLLCHKSSGIKNIIMASFVVPPLLLCFVGGDPFVLLKIIIKIAAIDGLFKINIKFSRLHKGTRLTLYIYVLQDP